MSENLKVVPLTKTMLREAIDQNTYWKDTVIPLPKSKALWVVSNNRIQEEDFCGVLAFDNTKIISFVYMIPDLLKVNNSDIKKVYWMILWWVDKNYQDTVLGTYIYNEAINLAGKQVIIKAYAEKVNDFYAKQPFEVITSRLRYTLFFAIDSSILIGRFSFLKPFKFLLDKLNVIVNGGVRYINRFKLKNRTKTLSYDYITQLDNETWKFIEPLCENDLILKTKEYVNWQIDNNQYTQVPVSDKFQYRSLQAGNGNNIHLHNVKIIVNKKLIGFLCYTINYTEFNVKYFMVNEGENYDVCVDALIDHFIKAKTNYIFTDDSKLAERIPKRYKTIFIYKVIKKAIAHKETQLDFENLKVYNRDGHFY